MFFLSLIGEDNNIYENNKTSKKDVVLFKFYEGETTRDKIMQGLNYYAYHKNVKDAKKYIVDYLVSLDDKEKAKQVKACPDVFVIPTYGYLARMATKGAKFNVEMDVEDRLNQHINYLASQGTIKKEVTKEKQEQRAAGPTIQDRIKEQAGEMDNFWSG